MKSHHLFLILIVTLLSSCTDDEHGSELYNRINPIILENPDSALHVLKGMSSEVDASDEDVMSYYTLLTIKAKDKAYIVHQSDSAILSILPYFEKHTDRLPEAYYYAGRVYSDMGDAPEALSYFQKALDVLPEESNSDETLKLKSLLFSQQGNLFGLQMLHEDSQLYYKRAFECDCRLKDTSNIILDLIDIANTFRYIRVTDSASLYYDKALQLCFESKNIQGESEVYLQKAVLLNEEKRYDDALRCFYKTENCYEGSKSGMCMVGGLIHYSIGEYDSAAIYWNKALEYGYPHARVDAYAGLANVAMKKGDLEQSTRYINEFLELSDSARKVEQEETMLNLQQVYNYYHKENKIQQLEANSLQKSKLVWIVISISVFFIALLFGLVRYLYLTRQNAELQVLRYSQLIETFKKHETDGVRKDVGVESMSEMLRELHGEIDMLLCEGKLMPMQLLEKIDKYLNCAYPNFILSLKELRLLNETDMQISKLLKLGVTVNNIAKLIGRDKSTVSVSRKRLFKKTFGKDGTPKDWDSYIFSL